MNVIIDFINEILWSHLLVYGLLGVGAFFTIRLGFLQFRHFPSILRSITRSGEHDRGGISPFQALCTSLAARVGTGNLAGVAVAIALGGPGAIFWMWLVALVGMATAYAESSLAQLYKIRGQSEDGLYRGGPAFYISRGLEAPWFAMIFAVSLLLSFGFVFNAVQANSIAEGMEGAFDAPRLGVGIIIAALAGIVIFGGVRKVARVAGRIVPAMAVLYLLLALVIIGMNFSEVPAALTLIVQSAFGIEQAFGGVAGAMLNGIQRGLYSNEAGMGSVPNIAAVATPHPHHPSSQGLVQSLGVFIDTLIICTATALLILVSGVATPDSELTGIALTQAAVEAQIGDWGAYFIAVAIFLFAFTSILGCYSYAESALAYLGLDNRLGLTALRCGAVTMVFWGSLQAVTTVFSMADAAMGIMATINLIAIALLSGVVVKLTRDYFAQQKSGIEPSFHAEAYPELTGRIDTSIWQHEQRPTAPSQQHGD